VALTLYATHQFEDDLEGFDPQHVVRRKLPKTCEYLQDDPRRHQGSLQSEPLRRLGKSGWEIQHSWIDQSYRIAWRYEGIDGILLLRIGDHDFIDRFATFNDDTIARVFAQPRETTEPVTNNQRGDSDVALAMPEQRIFADWPSVHLQLLGIPAAKTREVKLITDIDQVYDLGLPDYAEKNLVDVYILVDEWTTDRLFDSSCIFYRTNADQLEGYCKGEIKQLLLNLSPEQDRYVNMHTTGPTLVKGVAGSGKTTVGLYRAMAQSYVRDLFDQGKPPRILFVTYTKTLARVVEQMFQELYGTDGAKRVEVWVLREWLQAYLESKPGTRPLASGSEINNAVGQGIFKARQSFPESSWSQERTDGGKARGNGFFISEIADVIKGRNLRTWEEYATAERTGRKTGLGEAPRQFVWTVYQEYEQQLDRIDKFDYLDLSLLGTECLQNDPDFRPYDAVVVDEAQDLRPVELQVVSLLAGGARARNLVLLADPSQSIYYKGIPWKDGNIYIAPARSFSLSRNYRNTRQILEAAWSLAQSGLSDDLDEGSIPPEATERHGPRPNVVLCQNADYRNRFIVKTIEKLCQEMDCRPGDIAILARMKDSVADLETVLHLAQLPTVHFRDDSFDIFENNTKLITINSAKGLEFPIVFLVDVHEGELPRNLFVDNEDELAAELRRERRLLYVGMTRAARRLYLVCCQRDASRFLREIDPDTVRLVHYKDES
jgi:superfamily I DNA/RNA helicase